jgi:hypothetical protein
MVCGCCALHNERCFCNHLPAPPHPLHCSAAALPFSPPSETANTLHSPMPLLCLILHYKEQQQAHPSYVLLVLFPSPCC